MTGPNEKPRGFFGRLFGSKGDAPASDTAPPAPTETLADAAAVVETAPSGTAVNETGADETASQNTAPAEAATPPADAPTDQPEAPKAGGWFQRLRQGLAKTSGKLGEGINSVFNKRKLNAETLEDLEDLLLQADLGVETSERIARQLKQTRYDKDIAPEEVREVLATEVERVLTPVAQPLVLDPGKKPHVVLFVGVNGTGKTTTIGKLAARYRRDGLKVVIAAGDTFRAAAVEQLKVWGERAGAEVIARGEGADAAGLAFDALASARQSGADVLLVDTAGRLQNKAALMEELEKVIRVMRKVDATAPHHVVLVLDATTGQNALNQVEVFKDRAGVTGLVMTKLDGTARGGILVAISAKFALPIYAVGVGEGVDDLQAFAPHEFARAIAVG